MSNAKRIMIVLSGVAALALAPVFRKENKTAFQEKLEKKVRVEIEDGTDGCVYCGKCCSRIPAQA